MNKKRIGIGKNWQNKKTEARYHIAFSCTKILFVAPQGTIQKTNQ